MSWFFGKKKQRESPPNSPEEATPPEDQYIFVEKTTPLEPDTDDKISNLYPSLGSGSQYPPMPSSLIKQNSQENSNQDISNIPFKFCKELERNMNDDLVIDRLRLNEITSFIKRINVEDFDYPFDIEKSVISEMDSQNEQ